jgi:asparagine N-glycosylation enzyme membrane subunit Stt3
MIVNRIAGGCLAAVSFILFGLVLSSRGSSTLGIEVMGRLGLSFVLLFLAAQLVVCLVYVRPRDRLVPLLLFVGGTILYAVMTGRGGGAAEAARIPLHQALMAGASFSGLAAGTLAMMGQ